MPNDALRTIMVGKVPIGSDHPVAKQTMCTTVTRDVEASVQQVSPYDINVDMENNVVCCINADS